MHEMVTLSWPIYKNGQQEDRIWTGDVNDIVTKSEARKIHELDPRVGASYYYEEHTNKN